MILIDNDSHYHQQIYINREIEYLSIKIIPINAKNHDLFEGSWFKRSILIDAYEYII